MITLNELIENYTGHSVIIATKKDEMQIYRQLLGSKFPRENIIISRDIRLLAHRGNQYFDLFQHVPGEKEIFIDAGCYDAETSIEFIKWCGGEYEKIIAFEPDQTCFARCKDNIQKMGIERIQLLEKATWNTNDKMKFSMNGRGSSSVEDRGNVYVNSVSIDEVLDGQRATFIKMDVEGSELQSLLGAMNTIKKFKPKLAISIYHKNEDLYELAAAILNIRDDYKLYVRHYSSYLYETVLYAI